MKISSNVDFGTRECPSCATEVRANENRCPICGYEFPNPLAPRRAATWAAAMLMLALLALMILLPLLR